MTRADLPVREHPSRRCRIRFPVPVKLQNYEAAESKNDWDIQMFETQYEADLKTYEIDLKEEITSRK